MELRPLEAEGSSELPPQEAWQEPELELLGWEPAGSSTNIKIWGVLFWGSLK